MVCYILFMDIAYMFVNVLLGDSCSTHLLLFIFMRTVVLINYFIVYYVLVHYFRLPSCIPRFTNKVPFNKLWDQDLLQQQVQRYTFLVPPPRCTQFWSIKYISIASSYFILALYKSYSFSFRMW